MNMSMQDLDTSQCEDTPTSTPMRPTRSEPPRPPPPPKGKGKGAGGQTPKGKGTGKTPRSGSEGRLINFFWRPSVKPSETDLSTVDDPYIAEMRECLSAVDTDGDTECVSGGSTGTDVQSDDSDTERPFGHAATEPNSRQQRGRRRTIFNGACQVQTLAEQKMLELFQAKAPTMDMRGTTSMRTLIADSKHVQVLEIMVKNYHIKKRVTVDEAVEGLVVAIRECDYDQLETHMLAGLQRVVDAHMQQDGPDSTSVLQYVRRNGEKALHDLDHAHAHLLLYGVVTVPEVSARLECMHLESTFDETMSTCIASLNVLREGLKQLVASLESVKFFFAVCLQLGNSLNEGSAATVARHGFKLCALQKFMEAKSSSRPGLTAFHVAVALTTPDVANDLCRPELKDALLQAKTTRGGMVYQDCLKALQGYQALSTVARTGVFKGREIPRREKPQGGSARMQAATSNDRFWPRMKNLSERGKPVAKQVKDLCTSVIVAYNDVAVYLDDATCQWPPPNDDSDKDKQDLFGVFHDFVSNFTKVRSDVASFRPPLQTTLAHSEDTPPVASGQR